jgi:hydrogenase small subunit
MEEMSAFPGLTRREFLAFCGSIGVLIGAGELAAPEIAAALEDMARRPAVVWSLFQECLGCSVNLLQSRTPEVAPLILQQISLDYHEAIMAPAGDQAEKSFDDAVARGGFYYVCEGAVATDPREAIMIHGKTAADIVTETYKKAKATIAIGTCATFGGIQAAHPNPTGAKGVGDFLREDAGIGDATVINISRCPGNAEDLLATLSYVLYYGKLPELDAVGRPTFLYGQLVHDNCERRTHFEEGNFITAFGDDGCAKNWCWFKMGCKGPVTYAPCPVTRWNGHQRWCINAGPCTGCSEPAFWDTMSPFYDHVPDVNLPGLFGVSDTTVTWALAGITAGAIGAHFVGQVVSGRTGGRAPHGAAEMAEMEQVKAERWDRDPRPTPAAGEVAGPPEAEAGTKADAGPAPGDTKSDTEGGE